MSYADALFVKNCIKIINDGFSDDGFEVRPKWEDGTPAHTKKILHVVDRYDLSKDPIPMVTLRKAGIKNAIDEILWIYQKKTSDLSQLHSHIWDSWDIGDGTIGKAYGYQIGKKSQYKDPDGSIVMRDQIDQVLWDLKNNPSSRSILTNTYCHEDLHAMGLRPCAYMMTFNVTKDSEGNMVLNGMLNQRSQDTLTANNWNVIQYSALIHMLAQVTGMKPGIFTHVIADMHIYDRHIPIVNEMIREYFNRIWKYIPMSERQYIESKCYYRENTSELKIRYAIKYAAVLYILQHQIVEYCGRDIDFYNLPHKNPGLWINPEVKNFYDFKVEDFKLIDYEYDDFNPKIPVAI